MIEARKVVEMQRIKRLIECHSFQGIVLLVICFNAVLFGLQTSPRVVACCGGWLSRLDGLCLAIFTVELFLKIIAFRRLFVRDPWNVFDFIIVAISFVPNMGMFSSIRLFRVLRVFKLISGVRPMRVILVAIVKSLPGVGWASLLLGLVYYVYGILATNIFGGAFPDWFGSLGRSVYSLFQIMTLESWSMGIARPVIAQFPYAWVFFVSYIMFTTFIVLNIVVGIVLNSIADSTKELSSRTKCEDTFESEFRKLKEQFDVVEKLLETNRHDDV